jgi:pyruvate dehydrogenase E2 component (dihydrolipoamide acetyltransferase)
MSEFRMPSLGADMTAGTLVEWLKRPGDRVKRGDVIAVVETQKGAIEIDVFDDGVLEELLVREGATVPVGTPLALIAGRDEPGRDERRARAEAGQVAAPTVTAPAPPHVPAAEPISAPAGRVLASPAARRLAAARRIDLAALHGTGPGGAVISRDVEQAGAKAAPRRLDIAEMRRAIASAMARSKREIPHYYLTATMDMDRAVAWLAAANAERAPPQRLLLGAVLLKALALALRKLPEFNGFYTEAGYSAAPRIHPGVAISMRGGGLVAPAIHDADQLPIDELMTRLRDLVARARLGGLRSSEMSDATITMSSLGDRGTDAVFGVIYPPQVALVGFGSPLERPWVVEGRVVPRPVLVATLSGDHRASDGHRGALFLAEIDRLLQMPDAL